MTGRGTLLIATLAAGCGRVSFDSRKLDAEIDSGPAVCGDGVCAGEIGELCTGCASDCATRERVCGNGACEDGEPKTCYADCGPSPWPWESDATLMLAAVNQARTNGVACPGGGGGASVPALVYDAALEPGAREYAWEAAHQSWTPNGGCNGRTAVERIQAAGAMSGWKAFGASSGTDAVATLLAFMPACNQIMNASYTALGAAGAYDAITSHALMLR
jgi:hypothetical protein